MERPCAAALLTSPAAQQHTSASSEAAPFAAETITKGGLVSGERLMWDANERRGMLELRHKRRNGDPRADRPRPSSTSCEMSTPLAKIYRKTYRGSG